MLVEEGPGPKRNWPWRKEEGAEGLQSQGPRGMRPPGTGLETLLLSLPPKPYQLPRRFFDATHTLLFLLPIPNSPTKAPSEPHQENERRTFSGDDANTLSRNPGNFIYLPRKITWKDVK